MFVTAHHLSHTLRRCRRARARRRLAYVLERLTASSGRTAGKSTPRCVCGALPPDRGSVPPRTHGTICEQSTALPLRRSRSSPATTADGRETARAAENRGRNTAVALAIRCPTASASASRSPARWPRSRRFSPSTSRRTTSTRPRATSSRRRSPCSRASGCSCRTIARCSTVSCNRACSSRRDGLSPSQAPTRRRAPGARPAPGDRAHVMPPAPAKSLPASGTRARGVTGSPPARRPAVRRGTSTGTTTMGGRRLLRRLFRAGRARWASSRLRWTSASRPSRSASKGPDAKKEVRGSLKRMLCPLRARCLPAFPPAACRSLARTRPAPSRAVPGSRTASPVGRNGAGKSTLAQSPPSPGYAVGGRRVPSAGGGKYGELRALLDELHGLAGRARAQACRARGSTCRRRGARREDLSLGEVRKAPDRAQFARCRTSSSWTS